MLTQATTIIGCPNKAGHIATPAHRCAEAKMATAPKRVPWTARRARAEEIARRFEAGESPASLAVRFGLTTNHIRNILARYCGYRSGKGRSDLEASEP